MLGTAVWEMRRERGHNVVAVDWKSFPNVTIIKDIEFLTLQDLGCIPDHVHASFDCTTYTISAISHHRNGAIPKSIYAIKCDRVNQKVILLIKEIKKINPNCTFSFENPRGMLRKMPFMQEFPRFTVWYCQYGDDRAKPTDIWTDINTWNPRPVCHNGNKNCHHAPAPRGSRTGTQGRKGSFERSLIPNALCKELIEAREIMEFL